MNKSNPNISQEGHHLIKNILFIVVLGVLTLGCNSNTKKDEIVPGKVVADFKSYSRKSYKIPAGKSISVYLAKSIQEQTQGLSGVKENQIQDNEGMLFWYPEDGARSFWMPNTYTNLDIFFLSERMVVLHVERNVPAHPGMKEPPKITRTPTIYARHVLELKASSPISKELNVGDKLIELN